MTELRLYQFINDNKIEYHYNHDNTEIWMFINFAIIEDFAKLMGKNIFDEEGLGCVMKDGYFCFEMTNICDYFGIDAENVFKNKSPE